MAKTRSKSFWVKYNQIWRKKKSLVCIGLDSDLSQLPKCVMSDTNPIYTFNKAIVETTKEYAAAYKPNLAFYLAAGVKGLEALKLTLEIIPEDIPVILDCKVGDIGNTMFSYVKAFFDEMGADAITVNPLMGTDVLKMVLENEKNFAFVLNLTSNPSATDFLLKKNLHEEIAKWISNFSEKQVGAVIGATQSNHMEKLRKLLPDQIWLIPGIGAQGGDLEAVLKHAITSKTEPNILINSSRNIIFADKTENFAETAAKETKKLQEIIIDKL